jgi:hypothetical protein
MRRLLSFKQQYPKYDAFPYIRATTEFGFDLKTRKEEENCNRMPQWLYKQLYRRAWLVAEQPGVRACDTVSSRRHYRMSQQLKLRLGESRPTRLRTWS